MECVQQDMITNQMVECIFDMEIFEVKQSLLVSECCHAVMSLQWMSHEDSLKKVCAVCTNLHGQKATRAVSDTAEKIIQNSVCPAYQKISISFPQGLCNICHSQINRMTKVKSEKLKLSKI